MSVRQHPLPKKKKAFQLYLQRYPMHEIAKRTGVPETSLFRWSSQDSWSVHRAKVTLDYDQVARDLLHESLFGLNTAIRSANRVLQLVEAYLDTSDEQNASEMPSKPSLDPKTLESLSKSLASSADVLLRVFNK